MSTISRRTFLRTASLATVTVSVTTALPAVVRAQSRAKGPVIVAAPGSLVTEAFRKAFTQDTGVEVKVAPWTDNAEVISKMIAGQMTGVDLVSLWESNLDRVVARNLVQVLDDTRLPSRKNMFDGFRQRGIRNGKLFGQPHMWGYDSVVYNADAIPEVNSWGVLYNDKYAGKVAIRDSAYDSLTIAALVHKLPNPTSLPGPKLEELAQFLITKKKRQQFRTLWTSFAEAVNLMASREVNAMHGWMAMQPAIRAKGINVRYGTPVEGGLGFIHAYVIPNAAPNKEAAYAYLNWTLDRTYGKVLADHNYPTVSRAALDVIPADKQETFQLKRVDQVLAKLNMNVLPDNLPDYLREWNRFKSA